jgi:hypothetical protein
MPSIWNRTTKKLATFECVAERCERQQQEQPDNPAGFYWHAYALGQYSQASRW